MRLEGQAYENKIVRLVLLRPLSYFLFFSLRSGAVTRVTSQQFLPRIPEKFNEMLNEHTNVPRLLYGLFSKRYLAIKLPFLMRNIVSEKLMENKMNQSPTSVHE